MSEYMEGGSRFERINNNAFWANAHLDTRLRLDKNNIDENYNHIKDCIDNPTTGLIAGRKYRTLNYPMHYARNQRDLFECSKMRQVNNEFVKKFRKLYPKTAEARLYLINMQSIVQNYVKPIKKTLRRSLFKLTGI